ncbi:uncharacterized protein F5147DRAFT_1367 [Suillus discolor]|uniref:Uncharacterized protein n=1 Tax=Suillus discolor TaxID=1912936 RepID=A0A9P7FLG0_9AGAM|nr:uncharacterized protein F5147DRAFT_1367 [Suillus discolor]KAG2120489.1 hypothetical protein F5147DRAFT_1367 [Suillus discolor]
MKVGTAVKQELEEPASDLRASSIINAASQPTKLFLESSNADMDDLPDVIRQLSLVPQTPSKNTVPSTGSFFTGSRFGTADLLSTQFHSPIVQRRRVAMPPDFVEPQASDIILRGIRDPDSPSAPPRINPCIFSSTIMITMESLLPIPCYYPNQLIHTICIPLPIILTLTNSQASKRFEALPMLATFSFFLLSDYY